MGFDRAAGGSIQLGELQRRMQAVEACALPLGDGNGGQNSLLRERGMLGVAPQQDFAAQEVQEGVARTPSCLAGEGQPFVDPCQSAFEVSPLGFELGKPALEVRDIGLLVFFSKLAATAPLEVRDAGLPVADPSARPGGIASFPNRVLVRFVFRWIRASISASRRVTSAWPRFCSILALKR